MSETVPKVPAARKGRWVEADEKVRSAGSDRPSGWTERQAGRPQSVAAGSGVAAGPVCQPWTGSPTGIGRVPGPGRTARLKGPQGPTGTYGKAISPVQPARAERLREEAVLLGKWQKWQIMCSHPYCE